MYDGLVAYVSMDVWPLPARPPLRSENHWVDGPSYVPKFEQAMVYNFQFCELSGLDLVHVCDLVCKDNYAMRS